MKRKFLILLLLLLFVCGCSNNSLYKVIDGNKDILKNKYQDKLNSMTLDEKIAQMLIIYSKSNYYDDELNDVITNVKPGGFIVMSDNITTFDNTYALIKSMQDNSEIPMIIGIDYEGGSVNRLQLLKDTDVSYIPDMYYLGLTDDDSLAYETGKIMAMQLRTLGVNLDFAPVVDIYSNINNDVIGLRSFGSDKKLVAKMALSLKRGMEDNGVNTCLKHFPGHGDTDADSHYELPILNKSYNELNNLELYPYKKAFLSDTKMVMIGHIALPKVTNDKVPASLSKKIISGVLRDDMGFDGIVITDALNMKALTDYYSDKEIYEMAINAGVDILLMPNGDKKVVETIKQSINEGIIDEKLINKAVLKILKYKDENIKENTLDKSYLNKDSYDDTLSLISIPN